MQIDTDSVHYRILARLCAMPRPVRGISGAMLDRHFEAPDAVEELAAAGLIQARGWANGPGVVWVPTQAGEELCQRLAESERERPAFQPVRAPANSNPHRPGSPDRR